MLAPIIGLFGAVGYNIGTRWVPAVPRYTLVSYASATSYMICVKKPFKALKIDHFEKHTFFRTPFMFILNWQ